MRFLIHGDVRPEAVAALAGKGHASGTLAELLADAQAPEDLSQPAALLALLERRQWNLLTTDARMVRDVYEQKVAFGGVIVLVMDAGGQDQGQAIARLAEHYRRLTPGRLYTITPSRVKIRQLPGAAQRGP